MSEVRREPGASVFFADLDVGEVEHEDLIGVSADLQSNEDGTSVALLVQILLQTGESRLLSTSN